MSRRGEFGLIADLFAPLASSEPGALALTDDAAVLDLPAGYQLVTTVDAIVAGVHFLPDDPPETIARKLMRVNLSDLAAMGAKPRAAFLTCAFPKGLDDQWIEAFASGLAADVAAFAMPIAGGDTVSTPGPATFTLTALGLVPAGTAVLRSGARGGDLLAVTGTIGDGALGLLAARQADGSGGAHQAFLADRYRVPQPRLDVAAGLAGHMHACMDISDGLVQDLGHVCEVSGVGATVDMARVPLSAAAQAWLAEGRGSWEQIMTGGDDYELLMAFPASAAHIIAAWNASGGTPVTVIGTFTEGTGLHLTDPAGQAWTPVRTGFTHF
ncbi:thiamine-phosphate kinase [Novispirillum itersonii]|uniref:Thiamine-monophosphate kinase n=1 Tax=Novispirillum itersonii TaxID=189 RepID=A0A7X0DM96_NOVIT|nr:thiamine-phosphate kinase [Novispirillum itersonii]MBB6210064.1 thiamine-monophosphate kinase [Novispirillum itersonii]